MTPYELKHLDSELPMSASFGPITLDEDMLDALREIVNVAMGRAGDALGQLVDCFIELPVPDVRLVAASDLIRVISEIVSDCTAMTAIRQGFRCVAPGECFVLFGEHSAESLGRLTDHASPSSRAAVEEMLLDVGNLLSGACVGGIAEQLGRDTTYGAPSILCVNEPIVQILDPAKLPWTHALVLRVNFKIEGACFVAHVLLFWPEKAIWAIGQHLTAYLEGL